MHVCLKAISNLAAYPDYVIVGMVDAETGRVEMQAEPLNPNAASYAISGAINLSMGDISIVALPDNPGATRYTITGSFDPHTGKLLYVCAKPGSFHRPKYSLSGLVDFATGRIAITAESQRSVHPNYTITSGTE